MNALEQTTVMWTPNARTIQEAMQAHAIPVTQEMASTAQVCIDSLDMQHTSIL